MNSEKTPIYQVRKDRSPERSDVVYDAQKILNRWMTKVREVPGTHILLDLDENLFDSVQYWVKLSNKLLQLRFGVAAERLPDYNTVVALGGPSQYYFRHFSEYFPTHDSYEEIFDEYRYRYQPNRSGPLMHPNLDALMEEMKKKANVLGALTARPASGESIRGTEAQFRSALKQHPVPEILYRPLNVPLTQASQEKLRMLQKLSQASEFRSQIVLIDDSVATAEKIMMYNIDHPQTKVVQVLNLTHGSAQKNVIKYDRQVLEKHGILIMQSWDGLDQILERIVLK